jgi:hypothetical protein
MIHAKMAGYGLIVCCLISCTNFYDKNYYERASGIKVPNSSAVIESFDNGEWYTVTSFKLEKEPMHDFIRTYGFKSIKPDYIPTIFGLQELELARPDPAFKNCVYFMKDNQKLSIIYVVDTTAGILWASISYPDGVAIDKLVQRFLPGF